MRGNLTFIFFIFSLIASSQDSSKINLSGYIDAYYSYDFANPQQRLKNNFTYNHAKHNQFSINLATIKANYENKSTRANLALMIGDYAELNLSNEPKIWQNVLEANVGIKLSKKKNIWLDFGVMQSHIGFENAIAFDCWTLTRSLLAENSPYFETGAKLTAVNKNNTFTSSFLILNGWQNIERKPGFNQVNIGSQFTYKPNSSITLNYSNFVGSVYADSVKNVRTYHNTYLIYEPNNKVAFTFGFDFGTEKNGNWFSPVVLIRKNFNEKSKITFRYEYFNDTHLIVINNQKTNSFKVSGISLNYDYKVTSDCIFRFEAKNYISSNKVFDNNTSTNNFCLTSSINYRF